MATFNKYQQFVEDLANKVHDLVGTDDVLKVALTNTAPNAATHAVRADITEIATGGGYTQNGAGNDTQNSGSESGGTLTVTGVDVTFTATAGGIGPFKYVVLYNDTPSGDPLIGWWEYPGSAITLADGESFTVDFGASLFTIS